MFLTKVKRAWLTLAPKLIAFLATGLTGSGLVLFGQAIGLSIKPTLALMIVGAISAAAGYVQRDNLLELAPAQFSLKLLAYVLTSVTAVGIVAFAEQLGYDLSAYSGLLAAIVTLLGAIVGYWKTDQTTEGSATAIAARTREGGRR